MIIANFSCKQSLFQNESSLKVFCLSLFLLYTSKTIKNYLLSKFINNSSMNPERSIEDRNEPNILNDLIDNESMSDHHFLSQYWQENGRQDHPMYTHSERLIGKEEIATEQKISTAEKFPSHLFAGSLVIVGRFVSKSFHTNGEEEELTLSSTNKTSLHLETNEYERVKAEVLFASYLQDLISSKLAHIKFYCCIEASKPKASIVKLSKKSKLRQNFNDCSGGSDEYDDSDMDQFDTVFPIRIDIFLTEKILSHTFYESISQFLLEDDENEALKRVRLCQMLAYLLKRCNVKVLSNSLVIPSAKINLFMRHFRTQTIGHKKRCSRNPERLRNKIKTWKTRIERAHTYTPCVASHIFIKHEIPMDIEKYYETSLESCISWEDRSDDFSELSVLEHAKEKVERNRVQTLTYQEKQALRQHKNNNLKEVGADMFISKDIVITDDSDQERHMPINTETERIMKQAEESENDDEEQNRNSNMRLLKQFEEENRYFKMHSIPEKIRTNMKPYQRQALQWMKIREGRLQQKQLFEEQYTLFRMQDEFERKLSMFWEELVLPSGQKIYLNYLTGEFTRQYKEGSKIKGGILADEMGLGKTLMMLSLIADEQFKGTNLIVLPVTVMGEWMREVAKHCGQDMRILNLNDERPFKRKGLDYNNYHIVLVTYSTLAAEFKAYQGSANEEKFSYIFSHEFRRVILDEAHQIRESNTLQFKATMNLKSAYKWCLTGTLIQNTEKDLFPILKFLGLQFFSEQKWWNQYIKNSVSFQSKLNIIYTILRPLLLRRMKSAALIDLPQKQEQQLRPLFSAEELKLYKLLERGALAELDINMHGERNYVYAFSIINKLREFCCHPRLVLGNYKFQDIEGKSNEEIIKQFFSSKVTEQFKKRAFSSILQIEEQQNCTICLQKIVLQQLAITKCGHIFCAKCIKIEIQFRHRCPFCRHELTSTKDVIKASEIEEEKENIKQRDNLVAGIIQNSTKMATILKIVQQVREKGQKCVIFTQWLSMISLLQSRLQGMGIQHAIVKGSMSQQKRTKEIEKFRNSKTCELIIISTRAGNTGINLQNANNVILCDPWWNPSQEDQAVGRVHRLGQQSNVKVYKLYMKGSIEEKIEKLNIKKRVLSQQIMMNKDSLTKKNMDVICQLLDMMKRDQ